MSQENLQFITGIGRWVGGSIWKGDSKDDKGQPYVYKTGARVGDNFEKFSFGVAFNKQDPAFAQFKTQFEAFALSAWPQQAVGGLGGNPNFAWKVTDGDSTIPNTRGIAPNTREGYAGHWIVWFQGTSKPRVYDLERMQINEENLVQKGFYVRVSGTVSSNNDQRKPGIYFNYQMVQLQGYGTVIQSGPNVDEVFGQQATYVPEGMTQAPMGAPQAPAPVTAPPQAPAPVTAPPQAPVTPPPPAPAPDFAEGPKVCTDGNTVDSYIQAGWTEAQLKEKGLLA